MIKPLIAVVGLWICTQAFATNPVEMIHALGASKKGQFVAIEEYGFNQGLGKYYSRIKLMNVWKKEYVTPVVEVEGSVDLKRVREMAKQQAVIHFEKFNIVVSG